MLDYVPKAPARFCHCKPRTLQHQPYPHVKPNYDAKAQYTKSGNTVPALPKEDKKIIQEVIGTFPYYARCVSSTMLVVLGSLATQQANPSKNTMDHDQGHTISHLRRYSSQRDRHLPHKQHGPRRPQ
jgi:hypothetical protein